MIRRRRYLFIVQGEGRGHLTQALALAQWVTEAGAEVVQVLVGRSGRRPLPAYFRKRIGAPVGRFESPYYIWDSRDRSLRILHSVFANLIRTGRYLAAARSIERAVRESAPDVIVNFYDIVAGLHALLYNPRIPIICVGHQYLFLHPSFRFPSRHTIARTLARWLTRMTGCRAARRLALSFYPLPDVPEKRLAVVPPLLRRELFDLPVREKENYILVYLLNSGYLKDILAWCDLPRNIHLHCFCESSDCHRGCERFTLHALDDQAFLNKMAACDAVVTTAGFESVCEACYLGKPVYAVPVRNHVDHLFNAHDLRENAGLGLSGSRFDLELFLHLKRDFSVDYEPFRSWVHEARRIFMRELYLTEPGR